MPDQKLVSDAASNLVESYKEDGNINHIDGLNLPSSDDIASLTEELLALVLPGFFGSERLTKANFAAVTVCRLEEVKQKLTEQILRGINYVCRGDERPDCDKARCVKKAAALAETFLLTLPRVRSLIKTDIEAAYDGDPACFAKEEVILCYPGFQAIAIQRLAHELHSMGVPLIPRIMTEYGHRRTGVDIHPGAKIGERFFIDHATGVVIGETTIIGRNVKLYQGVTLGAKSFPANAREARNIKRHPTIEDDVIIYANATILGDITIGKGAVIGGNSWVTADVAPGAVVTFRS
ncbi:serine acetyltransferase [bacterium]|nr:serine acetyltransferase [bacterium]